MQKSERMMEMRVFDYSFLERGALPGSLVNVTNAIASLQERDRFRRDANTAIYARLESIARVQSVKGSNEIEGIVTSEQRLNDIVNRKSAPLDHNEVEIAGYRDALALVHADYKTLDVREQVILQLHRTMLSYTPGGGGSYKANDNLIMEIDALGQRKIRFTPTPAEETTEAMEQLIYAYLDARSNSSISQLLLIPCFVLDFLCIHPFMDGNGRISRLLSLLLLYKNGYEAGKYISFEEQINRQRPAYYEALRKSSSEWHENQNDYMPFVEHFIAMLLLCYKDLDSRFTAVNAPRVTKQKRIEAVVQGSLLPISKQEICNQLLTWDGSDGDRTGKAAPPSRRTYQDGRVASRRAGVNHPMKVDRLARSGGVESIPKMRSLRPVLS